MTKETAPKDPVVAPARSPASAAPGSRNVQLRTALKSMGFEDGQAAVSPRSAEVRQHADAGVQGAGGPLPHLAAIQQSFGRHDVSGVQSHVGGAASASCDAIGADAYATGDHVAFSGAPSLHTAAHEAAHVVQQAGGVHLSGGVGQEGDAFEQHADAVADRVVQGGSAEALLDGRAGGGATGGGTPGVQRKGGQRKAVQRKLRHGAGDLAQNVKDRLRGVAGIETTWSRMRELLGKYPSLADLDEKDALLTELNALCRQWLQKHGDDRSRGPLVRSLAEDVDRELDEVSHQRVAASQAAGQQVYMGNIAHAGDPSDPHGLQALSARGQAAGMDPGASAGGQDAMARQGLTPAEVAAIQIFTAQDYSYINPATANAPGWMASQKAKPEFGIGHLDDRTLMQEGSLHAAVAMQGLKKMAPYTKPTYRGARYTQAEFDAQFAIGGIVRFDAMSSSAQDENVAIGFASGVNAEAPPAKDKDIAVVCVLQNDTGRDIGSVSLVPTEGEVLILPGTTMVVKSLRPLTGDSRAQAWAARAGAIAPRQWWEATLVPAPKGASSGAPSATGGASGGTKQQPPKKAPPPLPAKPTKPPPVAKPVAPPLAAKPPLPKPPLPKPPAFAGTALAPTPTLPAAAPTKALPVPPPKKPAAPPPAGLPGLGAVPKKPLPKPPMPAAPKPVDDDY